VFSTPTRVTRVEVEEKRQFQMIPKMPGLCTTSHQPQLSTDSPIKYIPVGSLDFKLPDGTAALRCTVGLNKIWGQSPDLQSFCRLMNVSGRLC
jgi:hypothetical protein